MNYRILPVIAALSLLIPSALAQDTEKSDIKFTLGDDRYFIGENPMIDEGTGDVAAIGGMVRVNENIAGDVFGVGGDIDVNGDITGDVRAIGGNVRINGTVNGDLLIIGGQLELGSDARVTGDAMMIGGNVMILGTLEQDLTVRTGMVSVEGTIGGNTTINAEDVTIRGTLSGDARLVAERLRFENDTPITGNLAYWTPAQRDDLDQYVTGSINYDESLRPAHDGKDMKGAGAAILGGLTVFSLFSAALLIGILLITRTAILRESSLRLSKRPWWYLLLGLIIATLTPVIVVVLLITLIGIPLAFALLMLYIISLMFLKALAAMMIAEWINLRYALKWKPWAIFLVSVGIFALLKIVGMIPFIGWIVCAIILLMAYGALMTTLYERLKLAR